LRNRIVALALSLTATSACAATNPNNVIAAASTSSSVQSAPVNCLLDPGCSGVWSPGSADSGANEGVYVQFEEAVPADSVELTTNVKDASPQFTLSINGTVAKLASTKPASASGRYVATYLAPGNLVKSIFFRLGVLKGGWHGFQLYSIRFYSQHKPLDLALPVLVPASVAATSILEPQVAYQPANLFDSRYDFAWSTNGQTSKGKGESVEVKFSRPQNVSAMMVWNGYQRSETHFKANGRVTTVAVSDGTSSSRVSLADKMGSQRVQFGSSFKNVSSLKLTIEEIAPGAKYPDVLISELRFIDDQNRILIPQVQTANPASSPLIDALLDKSLSSVACNSSFTPGNFQRSLRLRKDGSFVIYGKAHDEEEKKKVDQVLEGNWELRESTIRIFGKRYSDTIVRTEYSQNTARTPPSIFQSELKVAKFGDLSSAEQQELAALIWSRIGSKTDWEEANGAQVQIRGIGQTVLARGADEKVLLEDLVKTLRNMNPWTIRSPILADAFLFSDDVGPCATSF
jgi:hypothetical protein